MREFKICAFYDTETTTIGAGKNSRAFPYLFIFNDVRKCGILNYKAGDGDVSLLRTEEEALSYIMQLVDFGIENDCTPIVAAYNLIFDLQPLLYDLRQLFEFSVCAQSSTSVYTLDLIDAESGEIMLRFWDTFYLEMRGLVAMGQTAGLPKAVGFLDYSKIRTTETPLTEKERLYAKTDVEVIPAYLDYLLKANDFLDESDLGFLVLTKTSIVRQMAKRKLGCLKVSSKNGKRYNLYQLFTMTCKNEFPKDYDHYALRKACFRGGFTFTAAKFAHRAVKNVASLDETSAHHAFINGKMLPIDFRDDNTADCSNIRNICEQIRVISPLKNYGKPYTGAFHAQISFSNIRLKKGTAFEAFEIGLLPEAKFYKNIDLNVKDFRNAEAERAIRANGYHDTALNGVFAYGKLMKAYKAVVFVNECEFCALSRVYDFDNYEVLRGEFTIHFSRPPDYVTLQSMMLFEQKSEIKRILKKYEQGKPYAGELSHLVPPGIAERLRKGTLDEEFLQSYYNSTVKGSFNGIYGTQAMDEIRCKYASDDDGELFVDGETIASPENFDEKIPDVNKVLYTFGMRIVGWSRVQLVLAIELLFEAFGEKIKITGGDTDSIKVGTTLDISDDDLLAALHQLHAATAESIAWVGERANRLFPKYASSMNKVGTFEIEECGAGKTRYVEHCEFWNKARSSIDASGNVHVTCAGVSSLKNAANADYIIESFLKMGMSFEEACRSVFGFGSFLTHDICHSLQRVRPRTADVIDADVVDYLGRKARVYSHESIALYECGRLLGAGDNRANASTLDYQRSKKRSMPDRMVEVGVLKDSECEEFPFGKPYIKDFLE